MKAKITSVNFGEIVAWIIMIILYATKVVSLEILLLFVCLKITIKVSWS